MAPSLIGMDTTILLVSHKVHPIKGSVIWLTLNALRHDMNSHTLVAIG